MSARPDRAFLEAENARTAAFMKPLEPLQNRLYEEMLGRIQETDSTVPARRGAFEYYSRTEKGKQYPIYCRRSCPTASSLTTADQPEQILLDCNQLAAGHDYFALAFHRVSPDGNHLAYAIDTDGDEVYVLRFRDLRNGAMPPEEIPNVYYSAAWASDNRAFFYTTLDSAKRPYRLWRHEIGCGTPDALVYEEPDARFNLSVERSRSGEFLFLTIESHTTTEVRYGDDFNVIAPRVIAPRIPGVEYYVEHQGDSICIRTNENAKNFRVMKAPAANPAREWWVEIVPHRDHVAIEGIAGFRDHLVLIERDHGLKRLRVNGAPIEFDEPACTVSLDRNDEYDTPLLRFAYSSLVTPRTVYDYNMVTRERELKKRDAVPGGYNPADYRTERIFAGDVPMSIVYRKNLARDGSNPLLLYGYGAYGLTTEPSFSSDRISLLDRGFVYAIAHVRGSGDLGRQWYEDGKLLRKKNTFTDFIACAEHLIALKYTAAERLAIMGRSAGGLLMGAVANMRPELFKAVVADVPFVDVLNTMLDPTLPLTITEYEEWGNPHDRVFYEYIKSYAPYENVERKDYPNILATAGLNDPRVPWWEAAKWVAKLREMKTDDNVLLLKTNMEAGHGGPSGRYEKLRERAFEFAFILNSIANPGHTP